MISNDAVVILMGIFILVMLKMAWRQPNQMETAAPDATVPDIWSTPYYLRYNTPLFDTSSAVLPTGSNYPFALGVPVQMLGNKTLSIGG